MHCEPNIDTYKRQGRRWGLLFGVGYLVFLVAPTLAELGAQRPPATTALVFAALAVFIGLDLYFYAFLAYERFLPWQTVVLLGLLCAITVGLTLHDAAWLWAFIYCGVVAGAASWDRRRTALLLLSVLALMLLMGAVVHSPVEVLGSEALIIIMSGVGMVGTGRLLEMNFELRMAREEVGRLAVAEERLRFARDLHDLLGHSLSVIVLKSELAGRLSETSPERAAEEIRDVERVGREALREVREAVAGYRQLGLSQELEHVRTTLGAAGIEIQTVSGAGALPAPVDSTLAWALREGVTNLLRHSRARRAEVRLERTGDHVELELLDDGVGGDAKGGGNGLRGLRERVAARDGVLEAGPRPEGGFRLAVRLPLRDVPSGAAIIPA
jgi:two-component system, NarL family, sensor histidine kinase DesK